MAVTVYSGFLVAEASCGNGVAASAIMASNTSMPRAPTNRRRKLPWKTPEIRLHYPDRGLSFDPPESRVCGVFIEAEKEKLTEKPNPLPPLPQQRLVR